MVKNGEEFLITVDEIADQDFPHAKSKRSLRVWCPRPEKDQMTHDALRLPLDRYLLTSYLGDGGKDSIDGNSAPCLIGSGYYLYVYLQKLVKHFNRYRPKNDQIYLWKRCTSRQGDVIAGTDYRCNVDCYQYKIFKRSIKKDTLPNPFLAGLDAAAIGYDKSSVIPEEYFSAPPYVQVQMIAGAIDSDGSLKDDQNYFFSQWTIEHSKFAKDVRRLCINVGIAVSALKESFQATEKQRAKRYLRADTYKETSFGMSGDGILQLQAHLKNPAKLIKGNTINFLNNYDTHSFKNWRS